MVKAMRALALGGLLSCWVVGVAQAQCVSIDAVDVAKTENFDTLAATGAGTATPVGWAFAESGTAANTAYATGTGSANTGDTYSFGAAGSSDRAFGGLLSGSLTTTIGACFVNNTSEALTAVDISYTGEQWRLGTPGRNDRIDFEYSVNATSLTSGTWTGYEELGFFSPATTGTAGAINGNQAGNRTLLSNRLEGLSIAPGTTFWIRWIDFNASGADDGLAIDDFSLTPNSSGTGALPRLHVGATEYPEGNGGLQAFPVPVSLDKPAGPGGVTFDYATSDGTATAASGDYVGKSGSGVIPQGSTSVTLTVDVKGDTDPETNENFFVSLSNVIGASVDNVIAPITIRDDDTSLVPIHTIQGPGATSPLVGQIVATSGIVTARRTAGFFIEAPNIEADGNALTSEGIYVFTGSAPPADAAVGNRVNVQGTVQEYVPSADPNQPPLTELGNTPSVVLVSTGNALPAPVALTTTFPDATGAFDQLERLEGMRVTASSLTVNAPTGGTVNETAATATSNGVFHAVVTGVPLAYRLPGVQQPDPLPAGSPANVPRWNTNPQVIAVSSGALGGARVDASIGCVVTDVTGPLDYTFRRYTIYPENALSLTCPNGSGQPKPAPAPTADDVSVASFNMERFFDDGNDPAIGEPVLTPAAYQGRLNKASLAIRNYLNTPDIVGTIEIESLSVLQTIAARVNADAVAAGQPDPKYVAYLQEGNDVGGIDVGFLVKTADVAAGLVRVEVVSVTQIGKATTWTEPADPSKPGTPPVVSLLNDRPPLVLQARVHFADGRTLPLTAIVVHQRSLNDADSNLYAGTRVRAKRQEQAKFLANLIQARQVADPAERLLVMGDFNAFEFNDGYGDSMGTTTGLPSPDDQTVVSGDGADLVNPDLDNLTLLDTPDESYSYAFDGNVQSLDHILANSALLDAGDLATLVIGHARIDANFPETARNDTTAPTRLSDHDPAVVLLKLKARQVSDLSVTASVSPTTVDAGQAATFTSTVGNAGPDAAPFAAVAFVFDHVVVPTVTAPAGWTCAAPVNGSNMTTVTCTIASLASGSAPVFTLQVTTGTADAGTTLLLAASVTSQGSDQNSANDSASAALSIVYPRKADVALAITGPNTLSRSAYSAQYVVTASNVGGAPATRVSLTIDSNALLASSTLKTSVTGWTCTQKRTATPRVVTFTCTGSTPIEAGANVPFQLALYPKLSKVKDAIVVRGTASTTAADADLANNSATFTTTLQ